MNFQQLRIIRETVRRNFNLTDVSNALYTSQSGVSKHIRDLEDELGVELYVRKGKRLLGMTEPGKEMAKIVERILQETANLKSIADAYTLKDEGELAIATTHTQARYSLPSIISAFRDKYPKVRLKLYQSSPSEIVQLLKQGEVDIGIATEGLISDEEFACFDFYSWQHVVVVPNEHPLAGIEQVSLEQLSQYPIITYHEGYTGRSVIEKAFIDQGITPNICMSALDADVIKSYVELGLGIGIIAPMAFDPDRDNNLSVLNSKGLFSENTTYIALKRGKILRDFVYQFLHLCRQDLNKNEILQAINL